VLLGAMMWQASVVRVRRWRRNVGAVCSIGIVPPMSKAIIRVGSGCMVQAGRAGPVLLTNWHCLRDIVDLSKPAAAQNRQDLRLLTEVDVRQSNTSFTRRSCSFLAPGWQVLVGTADAGGPRWRFRAELLLESPMREFATPADDAQWDVDAGVNGGSSSSSSSSRSRAFLPDAGTEEQQGRRGGARRGQSRSNSIAGGIDIAVLRLTEHILVHGIDKAKNNQHYVFENIEVQEQLSSSAAAAAAAAAAPAPAAPAAAPAAKYKISSSASAAAAVLDSLSRFGDHASQSSRTLDGGNSWSFRPHIKAGTTQLRLLGYPPDAGGYDMSILTTWLTGVDFEDRIKSRGRYLLANTVMPRGFSGGAAVDTEGTLIGICTAEHGSGISCIRDFRDLRPLLLKAERMLQREKVVEVEKRRKESSKGSSSKKRKKKKKKKKRDLYDQAAEVFQKNCVHGEDEEGEGQGAGEEEEEEEEEEGDSTSEESEEDVEAGEGEVAEHYESWAGALLRQISSSY
jgi:hypothetical protein